MTLSEKYIEQMFPYESFDNENKPLISKAQAIELMRQQTWEAVWWYWNQLFTDMPDHRNEIRLKEEVEQWFNKEI